VTDAPLRTSDYLAHIVEAIERIFSYIDEVDEVQFLSTALVQDAVIRNLEVIGEASRNIERHDPRFASSHPELPLRTAWAMRNRLSHGYFKIDFEVVWLTLHKDLPILHATAIALLNRT